MITKQLLQGLRIIHGDLKPQSIAVIADDPIWVKIGGFGVKKQRGTDYVNVLRRDNTSFQAPETLSLFEPGDSAPGAVDIWSLGCIVWMMLTGDIPLSSIYDMRKYISYGPDLQVKQTSPAISDTSISFVRKLLEVNPAKRLTASEALVDEWLVGVESVEEDDDSIGDYTPENSAYSPHICLSLHSAAEHGDIETLWKLIESGYDLEEKNRFGRTPLHEAALVGQYPAIEMLIQKGADIQAQDPYRCTPLHLAAAKGHEKVAVFLIEKGASLSALNYLALTPFDAAMETRHESMVKLLVERGGEHMSGAWRIHDTPPLGQAIRMGSESLVGFFLEKGANLNSPPHSFGFSSSTYLHVAATMGHVAVAKLIIENDIDVNSKNGYGETPLYSATFAGHYEMAKFLLDRGAQTETKAFTKHTLLELAAQRKDRRLAQLFIERGADVNRETKGHQTYLHLARYPWMAELLLEKGAKINATDAWGHTALEHAISTDKVLIARLLIDRGAKVDKDSLERLEAKEMDSWAMMEARREFMLWKDYH